MLHRSSSPRATRPVSQAVEHGATILQGAAEFFKQSGCVGCHHQPVAVVAGAAARGAGVHIDDRPPRASSK